ncbi:MAG TPA: presqualene diphosphate synthase HpnD [bacterium]|jgi:phytoene synthase
MNLADAYLYCDRLARARARNFYPAFRFLSRDRRLALSAFYAFCTLSDDIADDSGLNPAQRQEKLLAWRGDLDRCFERECNAPVFIALSDAITRFHFPREPFDDLLRGIEMDLESRRYATFDELKVYCRCVASSVGRVSVRIFGCTDAGADQYADHLGIAFQLTNILRDLSEDIARGRLYLPQEDLSRFGYSEDELQLRIYDDRFFQLMQFQYARAVSCFESAQPRLAGSQSRRLLPAEIMKAVYRRTLEEIRRRRFRVLDRRLSAPWYGKARVIAQTLLRRGR